jgi:hypothetical protein
MDVDDEEKMRSLTKELSPNTKLRNFKKMMEENLDKMDPIDKRNLIDPHQTSEYIKEIHSNMK